MSCFAGPEISQSGLILYLDPANSKSYSGSGNSFIDLANNTTSAIVGSFAANTTAYSVPTMDINNNGTTSNGQVQVVTDNLDTLAVNQSFSVVFAAKKNFYGIAGNNVGNSQLFQGAVNGYTSGWRITESSTGTQGAVFSARHNWVLGYNDINTSLGVSDSSVSTNRMCICAFTVSPSTIFGFVNGTTNSRSNPNTYVSGTSTPRISFTGAGNGSWNGLLGFFAIYNRTLSLGEITQYYNALRGRYGL